MEMLQDGADDLLISSCFPASSELHEGGAPAAAVFPGQLKRLYQRVPAENRVHRAPQLTRPFAVDDPYLRNAFLSAHVPPK